MKVKHTTSRSFQSAVLRDLRTARFVTQEELARKLNVTSRTVARWEGGEGEPTFRNTRELADFFGLQPDDFYIDAEVAA